MIYKRKLTRVGLPLVAASAIALPLSTPSAAALVMIGDQANLYFNGSTTARWNDNVFLTPDDEESDVLFIFSPGLELNVGTRENANVNLFYRHDFHVYQDNGDLDDDYANLFLETFWGQPRLDLRFDASYQQDAQVAQDLRHLGIPEQLIERDYTRANLRGEYEISELTSIASGINYVKTDYESRGFTDRDTISVPVNAYYAITPMVDLSLGYRYRHTDNDTRENWEADPNNQGQIRLDGNPVEVPDYTDHYLNVGARGELAPKLIGEARVGYQQRDIDQRGVGDEDGISVGVDFSHFTTPKTTLLLGGFRDFEVGGRGSSITATGGSLGVRHAFSHLLSGQAGVNYLQREWDTAPTALEAGREDDTLDFNVGVTYSPNLYVDLSAGYIFRTNDSNIDGLDFDNNIVSLSAALRY